MVTPEEMGAIDQEAPEPVEVLIERAGWATARAASALLPRRYGARVLVLAGKGNNGADGRSAARYLDRAGARCTVTGPDGAGAGHHDYDLVIDAAYGTGFHGTYAAPRQGVAVLAVDIPSGVDGATGEVGGEPLAADATVTFAALKPGLLLEPGRSLAGRVTVADIGLDCGRARAWHLGPADVAAAWPDRSATAHKWQRAVWVVGGRPGMSGAPALAGAGAARAGAGYVTVSLPGVAAAAAAVTALPLESVFLPLGQRWSGEVVSGQERFGALVVGPGLATDGATGAEVLAVVAGTGRRGLVLDGGAIDAVAADPSALAGRAVPAVLTPHDGELARLLGRRPGADRIDEVRQLAGRLGAVVLAKGPTTVAAGPDGRVLVSTAGDQRLATAGTGDVLAGLVGAGLAGGLDPLDAAGLAAELHGRAALDGRPAGLVAGDLPALVADRLAGPAGGSRPGRRTG